MAEVKTVVEKLKLQKYERKVVLNMPDHVTELDELEFDKNFEAENYDLVFAFVFSLNEFTALLKEVVEQNRVKDNGYLFVAYPKKNNKEYTEYIERDALFPAISPDDDGYVLNSTMKFARMVSFNDTFTVVGIKNEVKKVKKSTTSKASQRVGDYVNRIPDIQQYLSNQKEILDFYNALTPGYQRDWA
ncbi:hypothetical protein ABE042_01620 [Viridibacillus arvi]